MRSAGIALLVALLHGSLLAATQPLRHSDLPSAGYRAVTRAVVVDPMIDEISGFAASRRSDDRLWAVNDSENGTYLYAIGLDGKVIGAYAVDGAFNNDWEDLASYERDGKSWLLIADTGDNGGLRSEIQLIAVAEPDPADPPRSLTPAWTLRVRWPDGPRDCEGVAVDSNAGEILLMAKKRVPAQLFRVALGPPTTADELRVAEQIASLSHIPQPTAADLARAAPGSRYMSQITALDLSPDGRRLAVLTYRDVYLYQRGADQPWSEALARIPQRLDMPTLLQAEALAFARDGHSLWIGTEKLPAPILLMTPKTP